MSRLSGRTLFLGVAGFLIALVLAFIPAPPQATPYPGFWIESPAPKGIKGFYTLMARQDMPAFVWKQPVQMLPMDSRGSLMILVEPSLPFDSKEAAYWETWIENGNTLWLLAEYPERFLFFTGPSKEDTEEDAGSPAALTEEETEAGVWRPVEGFEVLAGSYTLAIETDHRLWTEDGDRILLADTQGVVAYARPCGDGELVVCLGSAWMQNEHILQGDHLDVLLALTERSAARRIWFNENIHGLTTGAAFWGAFPLWLLVSAGGGCLVLVFALWRRGMRFGPAEIPREDRVRLGDERIRALAAWYEQQKFYTESLTIQTAFLRQSLFERWGVTGEQDAERLENILRRRSESQEIGPWLEVYRVIPETLAPREYVAWSRRLSRMQRTVNG